VTSPAGRPNRSRTTAEVWSVSCITGAAGASACSGATASAGASARGVDLSPAGADLARAKQSVRRSSAVMRSSTAVRPPAIRSASSPNSKHTGERRDAKSGATKPRPHPQTDASDCAGTWKRSDQHFRWSRGCFVGLAGLEPAPSSLSAIKRLPLCNPAFLQVARIRNKRSNALFERAAEGRSRLAREVRPQGSRHSHSHAVLALKVALNCTKPLPDQPIQHPIPRPAPPLLNLLTIRQQTHSP
jgi:hypothetical protein